jgi:hypothetical protein
MPRRALVRGLDPLPRAVQRYLGRRRDVIVETGRDEEAGKDLLIPALMGLSGSGTAVRGLILAQSSENVDRIAGALSDLSELGAAGVSVQALTAERATKGEAEAISREPDILIGTATRVIDHLRRDNLSLRELEVVVVDEPPDEKAEGFNADIEYICSKIDSRPVYAVYTPSFHERLGKMSSLLRIPVYLPRSKWEAPTPKRRNASGRLEMADEQVFDKAALREHLDEIVRRIHDEEDPEVLNEYRRFFRRQVSIFSRGYVSAFLLKESLEGGLRPAGEPRSKSRRGEGKREGRRRERKERTERSTPKGGNGPGADIGEAKTLFISVGKNRKVFPKDILGLFANVDGVGREHVGDIKILDNYSFAEVSADKAQALIDSLDGIDYRGRKLTVNFARKKD